MSPVFAVVATVAFCLLVIGLFLRHLAIERSRHLKNGAGHTEQSGMLVERGKEVINGQKDQFRSAFKAGRQAYHDAAGEGRKNS